MPSRYYSFETHGIEFIALDTVVLPRDSAQREWLGRTLEKPRQGFRVVMGHFPIHSGGLHGDNSYLRDNISKKLCGKADIYVAGHDHHLEHLKTDCGVSLVVSGAAAEARAVNPTPRTMFAASTLGFAYLKKTSNAELKIQYIDSALNVLAEFTVQRHAEQTVRQLD
jgi:acid phosphatase